MRDSHVSKIDGRKDRHRLHQQEFKGKMLEVLIPCNRSSKVCDTCQIIDNQKIQPGKKHC